MDREVIFTQVKSCIELSRNGVEIENQKLDFKSTWYNLIEINGINEFLKDTSAIANTFGPDGLIIIGFDEKTKMLSNVSFRDTGLKDTTYIIDLINRRIDRLFYIDIVEMQMDGFVIGIINIPSSIDKPHVIRNYQSIGKDGKLKEEQHKIFIRRGTQTFPASKYDIELMFYDRKNIVPEYKIQTSFHYKNLMMFVNYIDHKVELNETQSYSLQVKIPVTLENQGTRPVSITRFNLNLFLFEDASDHEIIKLDSDAVYLSEPITLQSGNILNITLQLTSSQFRNYGYDFVNERIKEIQTNSKNLQTKSILLTLSTGVQISSDLTISTR